MNFLSLPEPYKVQIFKKLDWDSIRNVKLVCRNFYFTIEKNIRSFEKPKLDTLDIEYKNDFGDNEGISVTYIYCHDNENTELESKCIIFNNCDEYEHFLRYFDFTELKTLQFYFNGNLEIIRIFNNHYFGRTKNPGIIFNLISKIKEVQDLFLTVNFPHAKIPRNFTFPKMESLKAFGIDQDKGTRFITTKMISNLFINHPEIACFELISPSKYLQMKIVKLIFELKVLNLEDRCNFGMFEAQFYRSNRFTASEKKFYEQLFSKINNESHQDLTTEAGNYFLDKSYRCLKCGFTHSTRIFYDYTFDCLTFSLF